MDFGQWYQLLLKVTSIVYDELYSTDPTAAFSQLLFESIAPLYLFCQHQQKAQQLQQQQQQRSDTAGTQCPTPSLCSLYLHPCAAPP